MKISEISIKIIDELKYALNNIDEAQAEGLVRAIIGAKKVFVAGAGRSLLMIRGFAMRLMQMGFTSYVVGETVTPAIGAGDLLIIASGSGETGSLTIMAKKAKKIGAKLALITIYPQSTIGSISDCVVRIPSSTPKTHDDSGVKSIQPGASMFEQSLLLFSDAIVLAIGEIKNMGDINKTLVSLHANLE